MSQLDPGDPRLRPRASPASRPGRSSTAWRPCGCRAASPTAWATTPRPSPAPSPATSAPADPRPATAADELVAPSARCRTTPARTTGDRATRVRPPARATNVRPNDARPHARRRRPRAGRRRRPGGAAPAPGAGGEGRHPAGTRTTPTGLHGERLEHRRAWRPGGRGGTRRARRPRAPTTSTPTSWPTGAVNVPKPSCAADAAWARPQPRNTPRPEAADGAEHRDEHRLPPHHRPQLRPGLADGPQQAELPGPLVHRQRQRVGDAHEGDEDRQHQQHVDEAEQLVDLGGRPCRRTRRGPARRGRRSGRRRPAPRPCPASRSTAVGQGDERRRCRSAARRARSTPLCGNTMLPTIVRSLVDGADRERLGRAVGVGDRSRCRPTPSPRRRRTRPDTASRVAPRSSIEPVGDAEVHDLAPCSAGSTTRRLRRPRRRSRTAPRPKPGRGLDLGQRRRCSSASSGLRPAPLKTSDVDHEVAA